MSVTHVRQRGPVDCAFAVACALAGLDYPEFTPTAGLGPEKLADTLSALTGERWRSTRRWYGRSLATYKGLPARCALLLRQMGERFGHWVSIQDSLVCDPEEPGPVPLEGYSRAGWHVIRVLVPG